MGFFGGSFSDKHLHPQRGKWEQSNIYLDRFLAKEHGNFNMNHLKMYFLLKIDHVVWQNVTLPEFKSNGGFGRCREPKKKCRFICDCID